MANTGPTVVVGTVVEVRKKGDTVWEKFVCNEGVLEIDYGTDEQISRTCLEDGKEITFSGITKFNEQTFTYAWTQDLTNNADTIVRNAKLAKNDADKEIEIRVTMPNATGDETTGTSYVIPFKVLGYKHKGENNGVWETETTWKQTDIPAETDAA